MAKLEIVEVTRKELDNSWIPFNHVLIESEVTQEGRKTKGGVIVGWNEDTIYAEGSDSHAADMTINHGKVVKLPETLLFGEDVKDSMQWETEMELQIGDQVWFSIIEAYNATTLLCDGKHYKLIPYCDLWTAKRGKEVIVLNGYVLCQTVNRKKISDLDAISEDQIDTTRAKVCFTGKPNKSYLEPSYVDFQDLQPGDEVMLSPNTNFLYLERKSYFATFNGDNLYVVIPRRKIIARINQR